MWSIIALLVGKLLSPALGAAITDWAAKRANERAEANRPDILAAKRAQVAQDSRDETNATIATAEKPGNPAARQAALDQVRREAAE